QSIERIQTVSLPVDLQGARYAIIHTDAGDNAVLEGNLESNNNSVDNATMLVQLSPFPNLQATGLSTAAVDVDLGQSFTVNWTVNNVGTGATTAPFWK